MILYHVKKRDVGLLEPLINVWRIAGSISMHKTGEPISLLFKFMYYSGFAQLLSPKHLSFIFADVQRAISRLKPTVEPREELGEYTTYILSGPRIVLLFRCLLVTHRGVPNKTKPTIS